jgi:eukaryotic-like serine/threonine-protein kinase
MQSADQETPPQGMIVPPAQPEIIGRYRLLEELGEGGMSVVFRGLDTTLEREVAIKLLHGHLAKKAENRARFQREARAIARLRHPTIVEVYDYSSESDERAYIVMEYIRGQNLRQFFERHGPPLPEIVATIGIALCEALEHAHEQGIIHRDLKPENVMVCDESATLKLMDFGIAHVVDAETMTQTGSLLGSPAYMAPELIEGRKIDPRADIFSLGTLLYFGATGRLPFDGDNAPQVLKRVLDGHFQDPEQVDPRIGHDLAGIIRRCLASNPDDRFPTVSACRKALESFLGEHHIADPTETLKQFIKNPETTTSTITETLVATLVERGRKALDARALPTALGCFNRVLAYDPGNKDVAQQLSAIGRRSQYRRGLLVVAATLLGAVALTAVFFWSRSDTDAPASEVEMSGPASLEPSIEQASLAILAAFEDARREALRLPAANDATAQGRAAAMAVFETATKLRPPRQALSMVPVARVRPAIEFHAPPTVRTSPEPSATEAVPEPAVRSELYRFQVLPPAATLTIGGRSYSAIEAARGIELVHGRYDLVAQSPGCKPLRRRIQVQGPQDARIPIVLEWEDGQIQIMTNQDALVWVDDNPQPQPIGAFGKGATVALPFGKADAMQSERQVRLRIAPQRDLQQSRTQVVSIRPGTRTTVNVNFNAGP